MLDRIQTLLRYHIFYIEILHFSVYWLDKGLLFRDEKKWGIWTEDFHNILLSDKGF